MWYPEREHWVDLFRLGVRKDLWVVLFKGKTEDTCISCFEKWLTSSRSRGTNPPTSEDPPGCVFQCSPSPCHPLICHQPTRVVSGARWF